MLKRYEAKGTVEPAPHGGEELPKLNLRQIEVVFQLVKEDNNATLQQLCAHLEEKTSMKVSISTMGCLLQRLELTRKGRLFMLTGLGSVIKVLLDIQSYINVVMKSKILEKTNTIPIIG